MKKIIIDDKQLKNIINNNWQDFLVNWANYKSLINKREILENNEYENELIKNIKFLNVLKDELKTNNILDIELIKIYDDIQKKCWKTYTLVTIEGIIHNNYFDKKLKQKIINNYNKKIKYSNQNYKKHIIDNYLKTKIERKEYEEWKQNYFISINEKITKNSVEQGIDVLEYFKDEINLLDLQNSKPLKSEYKTNSLKI